MARPEPPPGALHSGRGTDCAQTALYIALMRAAGYTAHYAMGDVEYSLARLANWTAVEEDLNLVYGVFANGGLLIELASPTSFRITRVWADAEIDGKTYTLDAAMQVSATPAVADLTAELASVRASFIPTHQPLT